MSFLFIQKVGGENDFFGFNGYKWKREIRNWALVVAQLVERLLKIPEVRGSNPVIGKIYIEHLFAVNCIENTKIKKKRPGMVHFQRSWIWKDDQRISKL